VPSFALTVDVAKESAEELAAELMEAGAGGVEVRDGEGTPMPGVAQPAAGQALVIGFFDAEEEARAAAAQRGGTVEEIPDQDWGEAWKKGLEPLAVGRVFVRPSWIEAAAPVGMVEIVLDPGMAFGTGTHPTTSLCLAALSDLLEDRPGARVLDVGTGSGLLAIAARKLGASLVVGTDNDPVALRVARENADLNRVDLRLGGGEVGAQAGPFDLVVANILANTLVELAPAITAQVAPGGVVLLSGILAPQEAEVRAAYLAAGLVPLAGGDRHHGEWSLLALTREG
jgi:ribosomal protein L11 methyltransferase